MSLYSSPVLVPRATYDVPGGAALSLFACTTDVVRLTALGDGANASMLLYAARMPTERLNVPDTLKAQMSARVAPPMVLMSHAGKSLASVTGSTLEWHDALTGHSTEASVDARYGPSTYALHRNESRRSARRGLLDELWKNGLGERDLHATVNWFTKVIPADDERGTLSFVEGHAAEGDWVTMRADQDLLLVLSTAPHPLDPSPEWRPAGVRVELAHGPAPEPDDPSMTFRAESARSLQLAAGVTA